MFDESFQRADKVMLGCVPQKRGDVVIHEILFVELDQQRKLADIVAHVTSEESANRRQLAVHGRN